MRIISFQAASMPLGRRSRDIVSREDDCTQYSLPDDADDDFLSGLVLQQGTFRTIKRGSNAITCRALFARPLSA